MEILNWQPLLALLMLLLVGSRLVRK